MNCGAYRCLDTLVAQFFLHSLLKKNLNASRPSKQPPDKCQNVWGGNILRCKDKTSSGHLIGFSDGGDIVGSTITTV